MQKWDMWPQTVSLIDLIIHSFITICQRDIWINVTAINAANSCVLAKCAICSTWLHRIPHTGRRESGTSEWFRTQPRTSPSTHSLKPLTALTLLLIETWQVFSCYRNPHARMDIVQGDSATMILIAALMHRPECWSGGGQRTPTRTNTQHLDTWLTRDC